MPRLVRDETETSTAASTLAAAPPADGAQQDDSNKEKQQKQKNQTQKQKLTTITPKDKVVIPPPPPGVPEIQLRMWSATLRRRLQQLKELSSEHLSGFANDIREDFMTSRHGTNEYSAALALVRGGESREDKGKVEIDLAEGCYSSLLLQQEISPESIGRHLLALFYRSIDNRLPPAMSKHGLDALRRACASLDKWRKKWEQEKFRKRKRPVGGEYDYQGDVNVVRNAKNIAKGQEQILHENPLEPASKRASVTTKSPHRPVASNDRQLDRQGGGIVAVAGTSGRAGIDTEEPTSLFQTALGRGFSEVHLRGKTDVELHAVLTSNSTAARTTHDTSFSQARRTTGNMSESLNATGTDPSPQLSLSATTDNSPVDDSPVAKNKTKGGKKLVQKEIRNDAPKNDNKMATLNSYLARPVKPHESAQGEGGPSAHQAGSIGNKKMTGVASQANGMEQTFSTSDARRSELRVSTNMEDTATAVDLPSPLNSCDSDKINNADKSPSNVSVGYRRLAFSRCPFDDCPKKGGKCTLHGVVTKICKIEGCDNFQLQGSDVCIKHGAKNPNQCKAIGCTKKIVSNGFCTNHHEEFSSITQHSKSLAEPKSATTTKSQASSAKVSAEPQLSARSESQAASAELPPEISSKRERCNRFQPGNTPENDRQAEILVGEGDRAGDDDLIDLTADSPVKEAPPEQLISPPPSPPPTTIILNPLPPAKLRPVPFSEFHQLQFCADAVTERGTISGCVKDYARKEMSVEFDRGFHLDGSGGSLDNAQCIDVRNRLSTWDPYWKIIEELGHRDVSCGQGDDITSVGTRTTACLPVSKVGNSVSIPSCAMVSIDFREEILRSATANTDGRGRSIQGFRPWGVKWGKPAQPDRHQQGDRRLIMRCLPLHRTVTDEKKRADLHLWPLGSFVQIKLGKGCDHVIPVVQRKQQSHDHSKWLGNSRHLDLTSYISDTNNTLEINICSKEVIEGVSDGGAVLKNSYAVHVAICEYTEPDTLYNQLMGKAEGGEVVMPKLSLRSAKRMLKECIANNTITLDSDEEEAGGNSESAFLNFSLLCHVSKKCIETPVRGQHCTHLQCFDLRNYLNANNVVSAGRWRCPCCERFVSVRDLVHCGLFQEILDNLRDKVVPGVRDNVCVKADGTWLLLGENKLRYRKSGTKSEADSSAAMNVEVIESEGEGPEVIELL